MAFRTICSKSPFRYPEGGRCPVSNWYSTMPSAKMSTPVPIGSPRTCSGLAYAGVIGPGPTEASLRGHTAIDEAGDIGVLQSRQDLTLIAKAPQDALAAKAGVDEFNRNFFAILTVGAFGQVDDSHAAAPDFPEDAIRTDEPAL